MVVEGKERGLSLRPNLVLSDDVRVTRNGFQKVEGKMGLGFLVGYRFEKEYRSPIRQSGSTLASKFSI